MHVIRLHGPWTLEADGQAARRVHLPRDWSQVGEAARDRPVYLVRRFHRPTGLSPRTRVFLSVPAGWPVTTLTLHGRVLAGNISGDRRTYDLSDVIHRREAHDLRIGFPAGSRVADQPYFVAIEIEETAGD